MRCTLCTLGFYGTACMQVCMNVVNIFFFFFFCLFKASTTKVIGLRYLHFYIFGYKKKIMVITNPKFKGVQNSDK